MRSWLTAIRQLTTAGVFLACFAHSASATPESDFEQQRELERKNYDMQISNMPILDVRRAGDVLTMTVENRQIVARTALATTVGEGFMRIKSAEATSASIIRVQGGAAAPGDAAVVPKQLQFSLTDYAKPLQETTLTVNAQLGYCSIGKASRFPRGGYINVTFLQQCPASTGDTMVQLTVNEAEREDVAAVTLEFQAADFFTLIHTHQHECDRYLRPLIHDLGQEGVFSPDALVAWQVFAELWKPDPAATRAVQRLLPALDQQDFRGRLRASRELEKLGRDGAAVLIHLNRDKLTPEQNVRIDLTLAPYAQLRAHEAVRLRSDPAFLLDCLYSNDAALRKLALNRLRQVAEFPIQFDLDAAPLLRATAIQLLREKLVHDPRQ
jgi:hypothetical protein